MADSDDVTGDDEQTGVFGVLPGRGMDAQGLGCVAHDVDAAGGVGGGDEQQGLDGFAQPAGSVQEGPFHAGGQGQLLRHRRRSVELVRAQAGGQLEQRERVPACLAEQPVDHVAR